jgi:hypothetical protein
VLVVRLVAVNHGFLDKDYVETEERSELSFSTDFEELCNVHSVREVNHALLMKLSTCSEDALTSFVEKILRLFTSINLEMN